MNSEDEPTMRRLMSQFSHFAIVGVIAAVVHYGFLIGLVESGMTSPVPATLCGYCAGGAVSYILNRRFAFSSRRPHREAVWRFVLVAVVGFFLTGMIMSVLTVWAALPYIGAQVITTAIVLFWSFWPIDYGLFHIQIMTIDYDNFTASKVIRASLCPKFLARRRALNPACVRIESSPFPPTL